MQNRSSVGGGGFLLNVIDIEEIARILPHRYPFLLIDRVSDWVANEYLIAIKNVTCNEPFFQGHFPAKLVMPGVLIIEALAQATGLLGMKSIDGTLPENSIYMLVGIDNARFKRPVVPGDQLQLEVSLKTMRRGIWVFWGNATVAGKTVASAKIMATSRQLPLPTVPV